MAQLVLPDVDDDLVQRLKQRAARHGRTLEEKHRLILEQTLRVDWKTWLAEADRLRKRTPPQTTDSTDLIREERDRRAGLID
jgi:antitoxin FitA